MKAKSKHITEPQKQFLRDNYKFMSNEELSKFCGVTYSQVKQFLWKEKLLRSVEKETTEHMRVEVKRRYGYEPTEQIAYDLGTSLKHVKTIARELGIKISIEQRNKIRTNFGYSKTYFKNYYQRKKEEILLKRALRDEPAVIKKYIDAEQEKRDAEKRLRFVTAMQAAQNDVMNYRKNLGLV